MDGGAESPQETFARLVLIDAGLPPPRTQFRVFDEYGQFVARLDMAYDEVKVGIEYDGPQHWTDPAVRQRDIEKQFVLNELGWIVIRVSRDLLRYRRDVCRKGERRVDVTRLSFVNLTTFSGDFRRQIHNRSVLEQGFGRRKQRAGG
jgi:hypothetical protein